MITHPDKVLFPGDGITKGELAAYYAEVARGDAAAPAAPADHDGAVSGGIDAKGFIQKDVSTGFPAWLKRVEAPKKGGVVHYPLAGDRRSLQWLANQNAVTLHVWPSRTPRLDRPDLCVLDLDPSRDEPGELREAMLALRLVLQELGHASWVKTSGSKGFHVVVPMPAAGDLRCFRDAGRPHRRSAGRPAPADPDPGVRQGRSRRAHLPRHRPQPGRRHLCGRLHGARPARRARVGSLHVGRDRGRRGAPAIVHPANDAGTPGRGRRPVGRSAAALVDAPVYFFGGSAEMRSASVQVISSWSPILSPSKTFLSTTRRL